MNKKAQAQIITSIIMIFLTTFGVFSILEDSNHIYVGDKINKTVYDYSLCKSQIENIPKENQMIFNSLEEAKNEHYEEIKNCT